jgi:hypothetical protein
VALCCALFQRWFLTAGGRYLTMKTRVTSTDSAEFMQDSAPPSARVGQESSLEWTPTFQGETAGGSPRLPVCEAGCVKCELQVVP